MKVNDFDSYLDLMIVRIADEQTSPQIELADVLSLHGRHFKECPPTWAQLANREMQDRGWGREHVGTMRGGFIINGAGIARAHKVRAELKKGKVGRFLSGFTRSDWIAIAAFTVSVIAVVRS